MSLVGGGQDVVVHASADAGSSSINRNGSNSASRKLQITRHMFDGAIDFQFSCWRREILRKVSGFLFVIVCFAIAPILQLQPPMGFGCA